MIPKINKAEQERLFQEGYARSYGEGIKTDHLKAVYLYKKAAAQQDARAMYNLGCVTWKVKA